MRVGSKLWPKINNKVSKRYFLQKVCNFRPYIITVLAFCSVIVSMIHIQNEPWKQIHQDSIDENRSYTYSKVNQYIWPDLVWSEARLLPPKKLLYLLYERNDQTELTLVRVETFVFFKGQHEIAKKPLNFDFWSHNDKLYKTKIF